MGSTPKEEWTRTVDEIAARDAWILDGNYGGTLGRRLAYLVVADDEGPQPR